MLKFLARIILGPILRIVFRPRVLGSGNVPRQGPVIVASNHRSFIDSVVITLVAPRSVSFLAKESYFTGTGLRGWITRSFFTGIGAIPVDRSGGAAAESLDAGLGVLRSGDAFAIYPEGTRSLDGRLYRGRTGVAWLALTSGATVIPVALTGTEELQPVGSRRLRRARITVEFGKPVDVAHHGDAKSGRARRGATDEIMLAIRAMSGQEYVDQYNGPPAATVAEHVRRIFRRRGRL